jgi:glycerol transport system ATP-binding protein
MARIELVDLAHAYKPNPSAPSDFALRSMTMTWEDGGAYALLGPSGCGKTTLLNIISGLVRPSQKISLGRGLVRPDVAAVLFDEPLTVIDPHLKWLLRRKLKEIHHELKLSLIYVTHDQVEALTFADQVVVMTQGEVVQVGTAQALFEEPAHTFVGYFIGNPGMNLLPCTVVDDSAQIADIRIPLSPAARASLADASGNVTLGVRPEFVECRSAQETGTVPAKVVAVRNMGTHLLGEFKFGSHLVAAKLRSLSADIGETVWLRFPEERTLYYVNDKRVA